MLIDDPRDLPAFAVAIDRLLADPALARRMGENGHERVKEHFLAIGRLREYVDLLASLLEGDR